MGRGGEERKISQLHLDIKSRPVGTASGQQVGSWASLASFLPSGSYLPTSALQASSDLPKAEEEEGRDRWKGGRDKVMLDQYQSNLVFISHDLTRCLKQTLCSLSSFPFWGAADCWLLTAAVMRKGNLLFGLLKIPCQGLHLSLTWPGHCSTSGSKESHTLDPQPVQASWFPQSLFCAVVALLPLLPWAPLAIRAIQTFVYYASQTPRDTG